MSIFNKIKKDVEKWAAQQGRKINTAYILYLFVFEPGFDMALRLRIMELSASIPMGGKLLRRLIWLSITKKFCSDVGVGAVIGGGLYLPHPFGIVVNGRAVIGENVTILQGVTLGVSGDGTGRAPKIENSVGINASASVLGDVVVAEGSIVGANAVVLADVPVGHVAVGVPARSIPMKRLGSVTQ